MAETNSNFETIVTPTTILLMLFGLLLYLFASILHTKIIIISIREKEMTWKHDITYSVLRMFQYSQSFLMHTLTYLIFDLHVYTGRWICYTARVLSYFLNLYSIGHSLMITTLKYFMIVHWEKASVIGEDRIKTAFFWLDMFNPAINIGIHLIVKPDFFLIYDGITQSNRCLGETETFWSRENETSSVKLHNVCEMIEPHHEEENHFLYSALFVGRKSLCYVHTVFIYLMAWNIFEMLLYWKIFTFARR